MVGNDENLNNTQFTERAFFGRRKARALRKDRLAIMERLLPKLLIDINQCAPENLFDLFAISETQKLILEIGFGGGEHLVQRAGEQSNNCFIGCEPFIDGMGKALSAIDRNDLANIRVFNNDAIELLDWLPANCLDMVYLLYPDPWPKKRHWKRRFINPQNLQRIVRVLKQGAEFRFASDIAHYVNWTLLHCARNQEIKWSARDACDWRNPWHGWQSTRYEKKAIREGRTPAYLTFQKNSVFSPDDPHLSCQSDV